jgi:hypothetical protein
MNLTPQFCTTDWRQINYELAKGVNATKKTHNLRRIRAIKERNMVSRSHATNFSAVSL